MSGVLPIGLTALSLTVLSWALTYLIHSTVLLGGAWLVTRRMSVAASGLKDTVWKVALVAGIVTATIQTYAGLEPFGGRIGLPDAPIETVPATQPAADPLDDDPRDDLYYVNHGSGASGVEFAALTPATPVRSPKRAPAVGINGQAGDAASRAGSVQSDRQDRSAERLDATALVQPTGLTGSVVRSRSLVSRLAERVRVAGPALGLSVWILVSLALMWRLGRARIRLHHILRDRRELVGGPLPRIADRLCRLAGFDRQVRVTVSPHLAGPISFGRREVCVPGQVLTELDRPQQTSMLAHEIGHLVRRDPGWLLFCALLERILFFQPLNRLGRRQLQDTAEYLCDDYAIRLMGGGNLPLAKCLAKVASWIEEPTPNAFAAGMVGDPSPLLRRVQRLLDDRSREIVRVPMWTSGVVAVAVVLSVVLVVPGVGSGPARTTTNPELVSDVADVARPATPGAAFVNLQAPAMSPAPPRPLETRQRVESPRRTRDTVAPSRRYWSPPGDDLFADAVAPRPDGEAAIELGDEIEVREDDGRLRVWINGDEVPRSRVRVRGDEVQILDGEGRVGHRTTLPETEILVSPDDIDTTPFHLPAPAPRRTPIVTEGGGIVVWPEGAWPEDVGRVAVAGRDPEAYREYLEALSLYDIRDDIDAEAYEEIFERYVDKLEAYTETQQEAMEAYSEAYGERYQEASEYLAKAYAARGRSGWHDDEIDLDELRDVLDELEINLEDLHLNLDDLDVDLDDLEIDGLDIEVQREVLEKLRHTLYRGSGWTHVYSDDDWDEGDWDDDDWDEGDSDTGVWNLEGWDHDEWDHDAWDDTGRGARQGSWTPLLRAVANEDLDEVEELLEGGADPNEQSRRGLSPLHIAAAEGDYDMVRLLLDRGADPDPQDDDERTPLHFAAAEEDWDIVITLIEAGAAVNHPERKGRTALHFAAAEGDAEIVEGLVEAGATVDLADDRGLTPLHFAAAEGEVEVVEILVEAGADVNVEDDRGRTPIDLADREDEDDVVDYLQDHGARY